MPDPRITQILKAAGQMKDGVRPVNFQVAGDDEVARLGHSLEELSKSLERRFEEAELLATITQKMNQGVLLEEVLNYVYESFRPIIPYERIGFALLSPDRREVRAHWARSEAPVIRLPAGFEAPLEGSSLQEILTTGKPRILNDLLAYLLQHPQSEATDRIVAEGMRSSLTCPLVALGKPIGFIFFTSMRPNAYRDAHADVFTRIAGQLAVIVEKSRLYEQILAEQEKSERLLLNVLPRVVAERLKNQERIIADRYAEATVVFADIVDFTPWAAALVPAELVESLNNIFSDFDDLAAKHGVEKIKTIGDAYMAVAGVPLPRPNHAQAAADMALGMVEAVRKYSRPDGQPLQLRVGMHSGPVMAGVIGRRKFIYDLWGDAVNLASRMETQSLPGRIQLTPSTHERLREGYLFEKRGSQAVKGKGEMTTYFLIGRKGSVVLPREKV